MKTFILVALAAFTLAVAACKPGPSIPTTFTAGDGGGGGGAEAKLPPKH